MLDFKLDSEHDFDSFLFLEDVTGWISWGRFLLIVTGFEMMDIEKDYVNFRELFL